MKRTLLFGSVMALSLALFASAQSTETLLKSGDTVSVSIYRQPELIFMYRPPVTVKAAITDGKIDLPELGKVQAEGLSVGELQRLVEGRYAQRRKTKASAPKIEITLDSGSVVK